MCQHAPSVSMHHVSTCTKCQSIHACIHPCVCTHILNPKAKYKARDRTAARRKTAQIGRQSKTDTQRPTLKTTHTGTPSAKWPASMYRSPWRQYGTGNGGAREARGMVERERSIPRASLVRKRIFSSSICQARSRHEQTAGAHVTCRTCMPQHTLACRSTRLHAAAHACMPQHTLACRSTRLHAATRVFKSQVSTFQIATLNPTTCVLTDRNPLHTHPAP
jgi:hypothetical protein